MTVFIHQIATAVPENFFRQEEARDALKASFQGNRLAQRLVHSIYSHSGISKRHSVVHDFTSDQAGMFYNPQTGAFASPSTKARNDCYIETSKPLYSDVARKALDSCEGINAEDITHVVTVSCTGFFAPGPEYHLQRSLGLQEDVQRFHLGFMGCFAAFPALKMAKAFCEADPQAVVLVVCLELCTLHLQLDDNSDSLLSASLFADGAGAVLVSARLPQNPEHSLQIKQLASRLTPIGEADMAWTLGDHGFDIVLSSYVPEIIGSNIREAIAPLLDSYGLDLEHIDRWAVHPGGRAIVDKVQQALQLSDEAVADSRAVLHDYGNMSSATVLFVLEAMLQRPASKADETLCAMAFGPGLTVESALLQRGLPD